MTPAQLRPFKARLAALREEIVGKGPKRIEPNREAAGEVGGDQDEQPLNEMLQSIASNRNRNDTVILGRIAKALRKIDDDPEGFGLCEDCGEDLLAARLEAVPYAELCIDCQAKRDGTKGPKTRRNLFDYR